MKVLSLDPSTTATGYAVLGRGARGPTLIECGVLTARKASSPAITRVCEICDELGGLVAQHSPTCAVVETVAPNVYRRRPTAGLLTYAMGVGMIYGTVRALLVGKPVFGIPPTTWTRGKKKPDRIACAAMMFPSYDPSQDPGGDAGDAIGLGCWFVFEQARRKARRA
jgi:hypothetical protein